MKRDAITTLKNLNFEASASDRAVLRKNMTDEFLLKILRDQAPLRDQVLLILRQSLPSSFDKIKRGNQDYMKVPDGLLSVLTTVFNEADSFIEESDSSVEKRESNEFVQA